MKDIVTFAKENSRFYNDKYKNIDFEKFDFNDVPILTKTELQDKVDEVLCEEFTKIKRKELRVERTSGSTGKFTTIYWKREDYNRSNMHLWRLRNKWYGIYPDSRCVTFNSFVFSGSRIQQPKKINYVGNHLMILSKFSMLDQDMDQYYKAICDFEPEWFIVQNSVLKRITAYLEHNKLELPASVRFIELAGELTLPEEKAYYRQFFKIPIADMYGATEVNGIAYECLNHRLHILEKNVLLENLHINGVQSAVVTSRLNTAMPIIRYNLEDIIDIGDEETCSCGMKSRYLKSVKGRSSDNIDTSDNRYISPYTYLFCIEKANEMLFYPILQYKILQKEVDQIEILLFLKKEKEGWKEEVVNVLHDLVNEMKMGIDVNISVVDYDFASKTEKYKFFEKNIND